MDRICLLCQQEQEPATNFKDNPDVAVINNDTPMHKVGLNHSEEMKFDKHVSDIEAMCKKCGDF